MIFSIDLHDTEHVTAALEKLEHELFIAWQKKEMQVQVIYGIGEGILRRAALEALRKNPMVKSVLEEETGGSCVITM
jgi:dsDNA-specific endonuclease/ATPase MutS2